MTAANHGVDPDVETTSRKSRLHERLAKGAIVLRIDHLRKQFRSRRRLFWRSAGSSFDAVSDVSFVVRAGETLGLVGESGCGKTTVARCIVQLVEPSDGHVYFKDYDLGRMDRRERREVRQEIQYVFQDPSTAFNPRMTVHDILAEPLHVHGRYADDGGALRVTELLRLVGLEPEHGRRYPHEFSGGQRQRMGIARGIALNPQVLILDEPVSALDASVQAQVINLLNELRETLQLAYVFISHDLAVVRQVCDRVAVMYLGKIVEIGTKEEVFSNPMHPYTQALLSAVPVRDPSSRGERERFVLEGDIPSPLDPPSGCRFRTRCWKAEEVCALEEPELIVRSDNGHPSACHFAEPRKVTFPPDRGGISYRE